MAYKLRIRHSVEGKTLPLTLVYDDSSREFPEIPIDMTNGYKTVSLAAWGLNPEEMDVSKIKIKEENVMETYAIYHINNVDIQSEEIDTEPES